MSKAKQPSIIASESLSADEEKQMSDLRATDTEEDSLPPEPKQQENAELPENESEANKETKENKTVPHQAFHEERERRKAIEKENQELKIERAKFEERVKLINEVMEKQAVTPKAAEMPDPEKDALGALKFLMEENKTLKDWRNNQENVQKNHSTVMDLSSRAAAMESEYIASNPDYNEASAYLQNSRRTELAAFGMNEIQIRQQLAQETLQLADAALRQGKNPAEIVHNLAKVRGYAKKEAAASTETEAQKIARVAEGQNANQSLTDLGGGSNTKAKIIDAKDLATMSDAQFAKVLKNIDTESMKGIFGA